MTANYEPVFITLLRIGYDFAGKNQPLTREIILAELLQRGQKTWLHENPDGTYSFTENIEYFMMNYFTDDAGKKWLAPNAAFQFLEYVELQEARAASDDARKEAIKADKRAVCSIAVAVLAMIVSIIISIYSMQNLPDVRLAPAQMQAMTHPTVMIDQKQVEEMSRATSTLHPNQLKQILEAIGSVKLVVNSPVNTQQAMDISELQKLVISTAISKIPATEKAADTK